MNSRVDSAPARTDEIDLLLLWRAIWRFRYYLFAGVLVGVVAALFIAYTAPEIYRAEAVITEVRQDAMGGGSSLVSQLGGLASLAGVNVGANSGGQEARAVLESRRLVEKFITHNKLVPVLMPQAGPRANIWFAVLRFRNDVLTIRDDPTKHVTIVSIDWTDPAIAARWSNEFVALANEELRQRALTEAKRNLEYLNAQLATTTVVELRKALFGLVENEAKTLMLANGRAEYAFTVVDPAVSPQIRSSPKRTIILALGIIAGLIVGGLVAFLRSAWLKHHAR